jgi:hypothetical protein
MLAGRHVLRLHFEWGFSLGITLLGLRAMFGHLCHFGLQQRQFLFKKTCEFVFDEAMLGQMASIRVPS